MKGFSLKKVITLLVSIIALGFCVSLMRVSQFGTDPYSCLNLGISAVLGLEFWQFQVMLNIFLFVIVAFKAKKYIGLGTIANMMFVGFISDFFMKLYTPAFIGGLGVLSRTVIMLFAIVLLCFAASFYLAVNLGIAPYDALAFIIEDVTKGKIKFKWARILTDISCVIVGFGFGSIVGISTVITGFFTGPLIQFFRVHCAEKFLKNELFFGIAIGKNE